MVASLEEKAIRAEEDFLVARGTREEETMGGQATTEEEEEEVATNQATTEGEAMVAKEEVSLVD